MYVPYVYHRQKQVQVYKITVYTMYLQNVSWKHTLSAIRSRVRATGVIAGHFIEKWSIECHPMGVQ